MDRVGLKAFRAGTWLLCGLCLAACRATEKRPEWTVSIRGFGPIEAGMSLDQAAAAAGRGFTAPSGNDGECQIVQLADDSGSGVRIMVSTGTITRVDVTKPGTRTSHGAGIGDSEARVHELYPGRVTVRPHKYTDGHYLVVASGKPADSGFELIFETDGHEVTEYRSGRLPEVEYVEGCS